MYIFTNTDQTKQQMHMLHRPQNITYYCLKWWNTLENISSTTGPLLCVLTVLICADDSWTTSWTITFDCRRQYLNGVIGILLKTNQFYFTIFCLIFFPLAFTICLPIEHSVTYDLTVLPANWYFIPPNQNCRWSWTISTNISGSSTWLWTTNLY